MGAPVRVGELLADGKYEVTRVLGRGGMGVVVAAKHRELDKLVALKFMHEELSTNDEATERFLREARAAARLRNEHVSQVLDVGRLPSGVPYIVMEYLEGQDLAQLVEHRGPLEVAEAVEYVLQVCEAMAEAHAQGIIHRDLKPQNLFLTARQDGRPLIKVLDFGISKALFANSPVTTSQAIGSPAHMAPEQMRSSRTVDARADIWSLGVILYQLLSGRLPFLGDTAPELMMKVLLDPVPRLGDLRPGLPARVEAAVARCLEKDREHRFANVAELAHELLPFAPERARAAISLIEHVRTVNPVPAPPSAPAAAPPSAIATTETSLQLGPDPRLAKTTLGAASSSFGVAAEPHRSRWRVGVLVAASLAIVVVAIVVMRPRSQPADAPPGTAPIAAPGETPGEAPNAPDVAPVAIPAPQAPKAPVAIDATAPPPLAPPDATLAAELPRDAAAVDARPARRRPRLDAGRTSIDAAVLEPARTDDEPPLLPAR